MSKRPFDALKSGRDPPTHKTRTAPNQNVARDAPALYSDRNLPARTQIPVEQFANATASSISLSIVLGGQEAVTDHPLAMFKAVQFAQPTPIYTDRGGARMSRGISGNTNPAHKSTLKLWKKVSNKIYRYRRLQSHESRLLLIKPGAQNDPLNASLLVVEDKVLKNTDCAYVALSYNWGDSDAKDTIIIHDDLDSDPVNSIQSLVEGIMTDGELRTKTLLIRPNLHEALVQLRKLAKDDHLLIWVDALCINQTDEVEKQEQVKKMAHIYRNAENVCIWLGADEPGDHVSETAMMFIPEVIDPNNYQALLDDARYIPQWACLFELLRWSWFSRRWVIQELALAKNATVHCGPREIHWNDFQDAIAIFCRDFDKLKAPLKKYLETSRPKRHNMNMSSFEIDQFGAKLLVEITTTLFRKGQDASLESTKSLETLVCSLSNFDTSDPRDTINAFLNICKESNLTNSDDPYPVPEPDYSKDLFEVYRDFLQWAINTSKSLNIICRYWALPERATKTPTTPRLVELPSYILPVDDSAFGRGDEVYFGRQLGDSFVGNPDSYQYRASGVGWQQTTPRVEFGAYQPTKDVQGDKDSGDATSMASHHITLDKSLLVTGVQIGTVSFRNSPFADGVIPKECLEKLGWQFNFRAGEVRDIPDQLWQTLVADRGPNGSPMPPNYRRACQHCLVNLTRNGHINIDSILRESVNIGYTKDYLERVRAVTWERSFIEATPTVTEKRRSSNGPTKTLVGLGPSRTEERDVIAVLYGLSVPVILRPVPDSVHGPASYLFIGEAYIYGKMDGEAIDDKYDEQQFRLI